MLTACKKFFKSSAYRNNGLDANPVIQNPYLDHRKHNKKLIRGPRRLGFLLCLISLGCLGTPAFANPVTVPPTETAITSPPLSSITPDNTFEYKLDNGLKLIVREDHRAPTVVTQVWYKVGSSYEPNGLTGISHALEHMMFRGTARYPKDAFSQLIAVGGGDQNASTSDDFTAYYQEIDVSRLKTCFELEADRMVNLTLAKEDFEQEIKVVMEERRLRTEDNPDELTRESLFATAHMSNPYHHPTVGWMNDLENLTVEDLRSWYKSWYGPNNAIVVVVGDVKADEVYALAKTYFGPLQPITLPTQKPRKEALSYGPKRIQMNLKAMVPRLLMTYNVPNLQGTNLQEASSQSTNPKEPDEAYALLVLMSALDAGNSSRFSQELIRSQGIATNIRSWYSPFSLHQSLLFFAGTPTPDHTLAELEQAFLKQIERLQKEPLSEVELKRIKMNAISQNIFTKDSMTEQATELGFLEAINLSWRLANNFPENIQAITADRVQKVAQKYLVPERLTIAELIPLKSNQSPGI